MRLVRLTWFSNFMHVLNSISKHYTKNEYFSKHILFTIIYLMQEQKLKPNKYSERKINMSNFVQTIGCDVHMYAKFGGFTCYDFLIKYYNI
jgi:hypothetical protein